MELGAWSMRDVRGDGLDACAPSIIQFSFLHTEASSQECNNVALWTI